MYSAKNMGMKASPKRV